MKKVYVLVLSVLLSIGMFGGCRADIHKNVTRRRNADNSSTAFYVNSSGSDNVDTDSDIDAAELSTSSNTDNPEEQTFDTSLYKTMYVSGAAEIELFSDAKAKGLPIGLLKYGDSVSFIKSVAGKEDEYGLSFVYSHSLENFGYIKNANLIEAYDEVSYGEVYYIADDNTPVYSERTCMNISQNLSKNEMVAVLARFSDGIWRVSTKTDNIVYVSCSLLSPDRIEKKVVSSKPDDAVSSKFTSSQAAPRHERKTESRTESIIEIEPPIESSQIIKDESEITSSAESQNESTEYVGLGEPPVNYTSYIVDVDIGYLLLRSAPSADPANEIGRLYYQEEVYVINSYGEFWYVYAPSCGKYGFVKGDSGYLILPDYVYE